MAYANTTRALESGLRDRFNALVAVYVAGAARRRVYRQTVRELLVLSDRELADLGIHRSQISDIARQAAAGK